MYLSAHTGKIKMKKLIYYAAPKAYVNASNISYSFYVNDTIHLRILQDSSPSWIQFNAPKIFNKVFHKWTAFGQRN